MSRVTGGDIVVKMLTAAGVDTAFGINGAHIDAIFQAALDQGLRIVDTRHEMNAGHAAEGYARTRHALGAALLTAGGGFTNGLTSMANAYLDRTPVLYLAGSGPLAMDETNTLQAGIDQVAMAKPVTKWAHRVTRVELLPRLLARAIRTALSAPRGPVLLDVPWDVLTAETDEPEWDALVLAPDYQPGVPDEAAARVVQALRQAQRPVLLAGSEVVQADAAEELRAFAAEAEVPVLADFEGLAALSGSPWSCGLVQSLHGLPPGAEPDLVVMLGLRFGLATAHGTGALIPAGARVVQIDPDAGQLASLREVDLSIVADPLAALRALRVQLDSTPGYRPDGRGQWLVHLQAHRDQRAQAVGEGVTGDDDRSHPYQAVQAIAGAIPKGSIVVADGALTYLWLSEVIAEVEPRAFLCHGYFGSMGVGMGVALGAQAADPQVPVVLVTGDGALGYSLGEFDSMVRAGLAVVVVVLNNRAWGATLHAQQLTRGVERIVNNRLENGDYSAVAVALGAQGVRVDVLDDLAPALEKALGARRPACIDVQVALDPIPPEERVIMGGSPF